MLSEAMPLALTARRTYDLHLSRGAENPREGVHWETHLAPFTLVPTSHHKISKITKICFGILNANEYLNTRGDFLFI